MGNVLKNPWVYRGLRLLVAGIFLWAGTVKLSDPEAFSVVIDAFGILPDGFSGMVAVFLPVVEIAAALALIFDVRGALEMLSALMVLFMGILGYGIFLGLDIDCGCFGPEDPESRAFSGLRTALYRDIGICAFMALAFVSRRQGGGTLKPGGECIQVAVKRGVSGHSREGRGIAPALENRPE